MALPVYSNLMYPFISVKSTSVYGDEWVSINGVNVKSTPPWFPDAPSRFLFGMVDGINYLSTKVVVGQQIMFDAGQAVLVTQGGVDNYIADERLVILQEIPSV